MNGLEHIQQAFDAARSEGRAALMPYYTLGFPNPASSLHILQSIAASGADLLELGVPFSDPLADGPTIQHSTQVALENGITVSECLEMVKKLRQSGVSQPLLLMGYANPILAFGIEPFAAAAQAAGADGLIVPDLPPEEAFELENACQACGLALVYLLAPTSTQARIKLVSERSTGFIYLVSVTGVTGARQQLAPDLQSFIQRVRSTASQPLAVGFGISSPEQARAVGQQADGVIVGSALINVVARADDPGAEAGQFIGLLRAAISEGP